jgi:death on curing protein
VKEPTWLTIDQVLDAHSEQLALFGGPDGVRDLGLLESALDRLRNKHAYGETDLAALAAAYAFGISRNHPFVDGNKRTAFTALIMFLGRNGLDLDAPVAEATAVMLGLADGSVGEEEVARWIADSVVPYPSATDE